MKKMTCFNNPAFGQIRVIQADGKYLFCASDVAKSLGYKRPADAVTAHCKGSVIYRLPTAGGEQLAKLIPEGDVYRLIVHSKLPRQWSLNAGCSMRCFRRSIGMAVISATLSPGRSNRTLRSSITLRRRLCGKRKRANGLKKTCSS